MYGTLPGQRAIRVALWSWELAVVAVAVVAIATVFAAAVATAIATSAVFRGRRGGSRDVAAGGHVGELLLVERQEQGAQDVLVELELTGQLLRGRRIGLE